MLEVRDVSVYYGGHQAVDRVSLDVAAGEIVTILGANGAGKSTLLRTIAGLTPASGNSAARLNGHDLIGLAAHAIVEHGLALVPEDRGLFGPLSVDENLLLGAFPERARAASNVNRDRVFTLFPKLAERRKQPVRTMSGGEQQMVAIGRALMSAPDFLLLDEPSLGLSPRLCSELFAALSGIRETGLGVLLVEQNAKQSLGIADRGYLLENGRVTGTDTAVALRQNESVRRAFLGG